MQYHHLDELSCSRLCESLAVDRPQDVIYHSDQGSPVHHLAFGDSQYSRSILVQLVRTSTDISLVMQAAQAVLRSLFKPGFRCAKAEVMLLELQPDSVQPGELNLTMERCDTGGHDAEGRARLMVALDGLNQCFGRGMVLLASAGLESKCRVCRVWVMKQERCTPQYTTCGEDMAVVWT